MVARSQVQVGLIVCKARREGCTCLDACIDARLHPLGNHVDECAGIGIAGRRDVVIFHP